MASRTIFQDGLVAVAFDALIILATTNRFNCRSKKQGLKDAYNWVLEKRSECMWN